MNAEQLRRRQKRSPSPLSVAFTIGAAVGAGVALYMTPHSGSEMRRRLASGAKTAHEELSEVIEETRGAIDALAKDARETNRMASDGGRYRDERCVPCGGGRAGKDARR
jgi:hypothetical protein